MWELETAALLRHFLTDPLHITQQRRIRWRPTVDHPLEWLDLRIRHPEPSIVMVDHGIDAPVARIL